MKNKKGFTLVELLAVIIVLGIIALIARPVILNVIGESKEKAQIDSAKMYVKAVNNTMYHKRLTGTNTDNSSSSSSKFCPRQCEIQSDGDLLCDNIYGNINVNVSALMTYISYFNNLENSSLDILSPDDIDNMESYNTLTERINLNVNGKKPISGTIYFDGCEVSSIVNAKYDDNVYATTVNGEVVVRNIDDDFQYLEKARNFISSYNRFLYLLYKSLDNQMIKAKIKIMSFISENTEWNEYKYVIASVPIQFIMQYVNDNSSEIPMYGTFSIREKDLLINSFANLEIATNIFVHTSDTGEYKVTKGNTNVESVSGNIGSECTSYKEGNIETCKVLNTVGSISIGDSIVCGTEEFFYLGEESTDKIKMLAKYALNVPNSDYKSGHSDFDSLKSWYNSKGCSSDYYQGQNDIHTDLSTIENNTSVINETVGKYVKYFNDKIPGSSVTGHILTENELETMECSEDGFCSYNNSFVRNGMLRVGLITMNNEGIKSFKKSDLGISVDSINENSILVPVIEISKASVVGLK